MRDTYGRITPDFDAWKKLGYQVDEIHEHTYTLSDWDHVNYYDFINIMADYEGDKPEYTKERFEFPESFLEEFTVEEKAQIEKDIANFEYERSLEWKISKFMK